MDKMFSVQLLRPICLNVLFTVFLELTINVNTCTSNQEICLNSNRRSISYFKADIAESTWFTAWQKCNNLTSTLPVICDKSEQDALMSYLHVYGGHSSVWTSGKKINLTDWTWIDGKSFISRGMISTPPYQISFTHVSLNNNVNYRAQGPDYRNYYLCQYPGSSCNSEDAINLTKGCVRTSGNDAETWFNARNQCLKNGSDLAILTDADLDTLNTNKKLIYGRIYWVGLRKNTWHWKGHEPASDPGEEIKYSNWSNHTSVLYGDCISIDTSTGDWMAVRCTEPKRVVCQANKPAVETTSSTSSTIPPKTPIISSESSSATKKPTVTISDTILSRPTTTRVASNGPTLESAGNNTTNAESHVLLYSGVGGGLAFIIISIIVIILVVRHTKQSNKDVSQSKIKNSSEQNRLDLSPNEPTSSPANTPANAPVVRADDTQGVYAEISPATLIQPELKSKIEQPGVVYADLDFQREPNSLDPDEKSVYATANPPIYAN